MEQVLTVRFDGYLSVTMNMQLQTKGLWVTIFE